MSAPSPDPKRPASAPIKKFEPETPEAFRERIERRRAELNRITRNTDPERPRAGRDQE